MMNEKQKVSLENGKEACTQRHADVTYADLPLSCPPRDDRVWDAHPRVYLPVEVTGEYKCPYCGTDYKLKDFKPAEKSLL